MPTFNSQLFLRNKSCYLKYFKSAIVLCNKNHFNLHTKFSTVISKEQVAVDDIFPDVEGSPKSLPKHYFKNPKRNTALKSAIPSETSSGTTEKSHVIIACKNKTLNHYINQKYDKFSPIPLASKGWFHRKAKGDFFKINVLPGKKEKVFWLDGKNSFDGLGLDSRIIEALTKLGYTKPTYIQAVGIPDVLNNQNTLLAGETGCGKTLAYLLPVVQQILQWRTVADRKLNTPLALVLAPGRELALQIGEVADQLAKELQFDCNVVIGGHTKRLITHPDFRPVDLFICTTGAARKLTTAGLYNMSMVRHIVLDEADTILDDSFNEDIVRYLKRFPIAYGRQEDKANALPRFCQLTMASATMPTSISSILGGIIMPESLVKVETPRLHQVLVHVPQVFYRVGQSEKPAKLIEIAKANAKNGTPTIIFSNRSKVSDWVSMFLNENGVSSINLNGDMPMDIRNGQFHQFQRGYVDFLSCTDVAARGLDTIRAKHVLNYDFPIYAADYIHRCGRVGRVGHVDKCMITNFVSGPAEIQLVQKIETAVRTMSAIHNVNANITRVIHHKILKDDLKV